MIHSLVRSFVHAFILHITNCILQGIKRHKKHRGCYNSAWSESRSLGCDQEIHNQQETARTPWSRPTVVYHLVKYSQLTIHKYVVYLVKFQYNFGSRRKLVSHPLATVWHWLSRSGMGETRCFTNKSLFSSFSVDNTGNSIMSTSTAPTTYRAIVYDKPTFTLSFWDSSGFLRVIPSDVRFETINEVEDII